MDTSLVIAHSDKQLAAGTYKGSWGHHPLMAWCDNTGESLALPLRTGSAGSNATADHLQVLEQAITQIPARYPRDLLITVDGAGASHGLVEHISALNARPGYRVHYSIGWELGAREHTTLGWVPASAWGAVLDRYGAPRDLNEAGVVELTALLRQGPYGDHLANWPKDLRIICRREKPHPGAQLTLFEAADGWRYQLLATNTPATAAQFLEARHQTHARVEDNIRTAKQAGLGHLPSTSIEINQSWCVAATITVDLLCWLRLLCLDGPWPKPSRKPCATGCYTPPPASSAANANAQSASPQPGPRHANSPLASLQRSVCPHQHDVDHIAPLPTKGTTPGPVEPRRSLDATVRPAA